MVERTYKARIISKAEWQPSEAQEQAAVISWWDTCYSRKMKIPASLLIHIPNEGKRSCVTGRRMKDIGLRSGTPDLVLAVRRGDCGALWIEMKRSKGGTVSAPQKAMHEFLASGGHKAVVCHGAAEAMEAIKHYLAG